MISLYESMLAAETDEAILVISQEAQLLYKSF